MNKRALGVWGRHRPQWQVDAIVKFSTGHSRVFSQYAASGTPEESAGLALGNDNEFYLSEMERRLAVEAEAPDVAARANAFLRDALTRAGLDRRQIADVHAEWLYNTSDVFGVMYHRRSDIRAAYDAYRNALGEHYGVCRRKRLLDEPVTCAN